jgi:alkylation response protein AidB-like acyl-CoA dehydrogenase
MTQELQEIRSLAREFAAAELRPYGEAWDADRRFGADVVAKLAELGFFGMLIAEADGGMGFGLPAYAAALEELAWGEPAVALLVAHSAAAADFIARHGSAAQREEWLGAMAAGELFGCLAFSEEDHDDDALRTRAVRDHDGWRLRGRKRWVSNGDRADLAVVLAGTDEGDALFAVPRQAGWQTGARADTLGLRPIALVDLEFDAALEAKHELGVAPQDPRGDGDGVGRVSTAVIAVGIAQAALEHAVRYAAEREQFGRPIRSFDGIQQKLAEMATRTAAARALLERAVAEPADVALTAMAKIAAADCAMYVTTEAVQVFGGYGYMRDYPVEKLMRDAKSTQIMHGSTDTLRRRVAEALYA